MTGTTAGPTRRQVHADDGTLLGTVEMQARARRACPEHVWAARDPHGTFVGGAARSADAEQLLRARHTATSASQAR